MIEKLKTEIGIGWICWLGRILKWTEPKMADSLTTKRSQRVREAICRKSAQTFHLPLVKYEDEYSLCDWKSLSFYFGKNSEIWILDSNSWVAKNMNGGGMGGGGKKYELPYIPRKVEQGDMEEKVEY